MLSLSTDNLLYINHSMCFMCTWLLEHLTLSFLKKNKRWILWQAESHRAQWKTLQTKVTKCNCLACDIWKIIAEINSQRDYYSQIVTD